ncbi:hypothetical protein ABEB36_000415 [Hypothenemus hampei]|uniref:Uncharacterized protein n=1 Tax=Hypothenemus hampei TaxID=57062 RepID=A0ABD1FEB3_HYPHA
MAREEDVPSPDVGYLSEESSSPAPSLTESILDILSPEVFKDSDDSLKDPTVQFSSNVFKSEETSDSNSENGNTYSLELDKEIQQLDCMNMESQIISNNYRNKFVENNKLNELNELETKTVDNNHLNYGASTSSYIEPNIYDKDVSHTFVLRNSGNFKEYLQGNLHPKYGKEQKEKEYYPCHKCKALLSKKYLSRHRKKCIIQNISEQNTQNKIRELAQSQTMIACSLDENNTISKLRVKEEVFARMPADSVSLTAKTDYLITMFGENYLKKHKREQIITVCSNKMRELARLLLVVFKILFQPNFILQDILTPKLFDVSIEAAKQLGSYNVQHKTYKCPSLSAHLGTSLKQVCELFIRLILKEDSSIKVENKEQTLKETKRFKELIETQWTTEISSLAFKNLSKKRWARPVISPLTSDIKKLKDYITQAADKAISILKQNQNNKKEFKILVEASLILTILFNRRRIGDVQYTFLKTYTEHNITYNQKECENALSETEILLTKHYKRLVTGGKGNKSIAILLSLKLQEFIDFFINVRLNTDIVFNENPYLFGCPGTTYWPP